MKKLLLSFVLIATALVASAQQRDDENFARRLFEARLAEVCLKLNLTDDQKAKFTPLYEQYCNEMRELRGKNHEGRRPGPGHPGGFKPGKDGKPAGFQPGKDGKPGGFKPGHDMKDGKPDFKDGKPEKKENAADKDKKPGKKPEAKDDNAGKKPGEFRPGKDGKPEGFKPNHEPKVSDAEKVKAMKERMEMKKKAQEIRLNYADKFATVLNDKQLVKFFEVENDIQDKLHSRAHGRK